MYVIPDTGEVTFRDFETLMDLEVYFLVASDNKLFYSTPVPLIRYNIIPQTPINLLFQPMFSPEPKCDPIIIDIENLYTVKNASTLWTCQMPEIIDANVGDTVALTIPAGFKSKFMSFDFSTNLLSVEMSKLTEKEIGSHEITLLLTDSSNTINQYKLGIIISNKFSVDLGGEDDGSGNLNVNTTG